MNQVVEMGAVPSAGCGSFGCGELSVENIPGKGIRCRGEDGSFVRCPSSVMGDMGLFVSQKQGRKGQVPDEGYAIVTTPHPRHETGDDFYQAVTKRGARSLSSRWPGRVRRLTDYLGGRSAARAAGIGQMESLRGSVSFMPYMIEPGKLALGNVAGTFLPSGVDMALGLLGTGPRVRAGAQFATGLLGGLGFLFYRRNSLILGMSTALMPGLIRGTLSGVASFFMNRRGAATGSENAGAKGAMGQLLPSEKNRLQRAVTQAFGKQAELQGAMGQLEPTGFETIVPGDYGDLADSSQEVAGIAGGAVGTDDFSPVG